MSDTLLLHLAEEELVYLLRALNVTTSPGLEPAPLSNLDEKQRERVLSIADRTLRARGTIRWNGQEERLVDPLVAAILLDYAHPRYTLFLDILYSGKVNLRYLFIFGTYAIIEHCVPEPGVHQFVAIPTISDLAKRLHLLLTMQEVPLDSSTPGQISHKVLTSAIEVVSTNLERATHILASVLPEETANGLAATLNAPKIVQYLAQWEKTPTERHQKPDMALTIVQGNEHLYLLWIEKPGISQTEVIPTTPAQAWEYVNKLLQAASSKASPESDIASTMGNVDSITL